MVSRAAVNGEFFTRDVEKIANQPVGSGNLCANAGRLLQRDRRSPRELGYAARGP